MTAHATQDLVAALPLEITIGETSDAVILTAIGEIDMSTAPILDSCLDAAIEQHRSNVVIDASGVMFLDSSGLNTLLKARARLTPGRDLIVRNPIPVVERVFTLSGLGGLIEQATGQRSPTIGG